MIEVVIFDLDGTLADSFEDIACAANHALVRLDRPPLSIEFIKTKVGHGLRNLMVGLLDETTDKEIDRSIELVMEFYEDHPTVHTQLYPGTIEMLDRLMGMNVQRCVLSNKIDCLVQRIGENLGLNSRMDEVWGQREGYPLKPDPASLHEILKGMQAAPANSLVVGDAIPDRQLAQNAGASFCGVSYGMMKRSQWEEIGVECVIDSLPELPGVLEVLGKSSQD